MTEPEIFYQEPVPLPDRHRLRFDHTGVYLDGRKIKATQLHINASPDQPGQVFAHITVLVEPTIDLPLDEVRLIDSETKREG